jgi:peptidoglycan hydrolase CwlO-like protein
MNDWNYLVFTVVAVALKILGVNVVMTNRSNPMDANQLQELATNARLDHWPPHLGVRTDAEKIDCLTERLQEAADAETRADELSDQLETTQEQSNEYERRLEAANAEIFDLNAAIKDLKAKLQ